MGKKIYVGNLSFNFDSEALGSMFSSFGEVTSANVITDKFSGRSKGFGFVEMSDASAAESAIAKLHGTEQGGRQITVSEAKPQEPRTGGFGGGGGSRGGGGGSRY